ncbi:uncharacterized protein J3R85_006349 [Psidium guajava]|nr:uncharacterized protein J3R85_006349 [Psidium guajava]
MEEYTPIAVASIGQEFSLVMSFMAMGDVVTRDTFDWLFANDNKMVRASGVACRLMDDIAGYKFEQERGHVASAVECFMKQYGVTEEKAKEELRRQVLDAWKDINEELSHPTAVPRQVLVRVLNLTRATHAVYIDEKDHYTHAETLLKECVTSVLVDPLPM